MKRVRQVVMWFLMVVLVAGCTAGFALTTFLAMTLNRPWREIVALALVGLAYVLTFRWVTSSRRNRRGSGAEFPR